MIGLDINKLSKVLQNRTPKSIDPMRKFSVLIPLIKIWDEWEIIFEMRAKGMKSQPGEISFPGGGVEGSESYMEAAIRETIEELNIKRGNIEIIGELDYLVSYANIIIHCFLGVIDGVDIEKIQPNPAEVDHIFTVPLKFLLENEPKEYYLELENRYNDEFPYNLIPNGEDYDFRTVKRSIYFYEYNDYVIWGFTAEMLKHLIDIIKELP